MLVTNIQQSDLEFQASVSSAVPKHKLLCPELGLKTRWTSNGFISEYYEKYRHNQVEQ